MPSGDSLLIPLVLPGAELLAENSWGCHIQALGDPQNLEIYSTIRAGQEGAAMGGSGEQEVTPGDVA